MVWPYLGRNRRPLVWDAGIHLVLQGVQVLHRTLEGNTLLSASLSVSHVSLTLVSSNVLGCLLALGQMNKNQGVKQNSMPKIDL